MSQFTADNGHNGFPPQTPTLKGAVAGFGGEGSGVHGPVAIQVDKGDIRRGAGGQGAAGDPQETGRVSAHFGD